MKPKHKGYAELFYEPVSDVEFPDYKNSILRPMDMRTIEQKLNNREYKSAYEFGDDVRLMFSNCHVYNYGNRVVTKLADDLQYVFEPLFMKVLSSLVAEEAQSPPSPPPSPPSSDDPVVKMLQTMTSDAMHGRYDEVTMKLSNLQECLNKQCDDEPATIHNATNGSDNNNSVCSCIDDLQVDVSCVEPANKRRRSGQVARHTVRFSMSHNEKRELLADLHKVPGKWMLLMHSFPFWVGIYCFWFSSDSIKSAGTGELADEMRRSEASEWHYSWHRKFADRNAVRTATVCETMQELVNGMSDNWANLLYGFEKIFSVYFVEIYPTRPMLHSE